MIKRLAFCFVTLAAVAAFVQADTAQADSPATSAGYFQAEPQPMSVYTPDPEPMQGAMTVCEARTICANNGAPIWCRVWGGAPGYSSCTWQVWPGRAVECRGYVQGPNGWMWQRFFFRCF